VEAVGIEPTSGGQSPQDTTSVAHVLPSPGGRPQAGLSLGQFAGVVATAVAPGRPEVAGEAEDRAIRHRNEKG
jgi:hypothetical protein